MYYNITINAADTTIDQPIIYSISRDVSEYLNLNAIDDLKIIEEDGIQKTNGEDRMSKSAYLEVSHSFDEQDADATNKLSSYLLYGDFILNCNYIVRELKLTLKLSGKSKTKITSVKNKLKQVMLHKGNTMTHNIAYRYYMNYAFIHLINDIYTIRKNSGCYINTFQDYINDLIVDSRTSLTSNQVGDVNKINMVFKEEQTDIVGVFEDNNMNKEIDYDKDKGLYTVSLDYSINMSLPFEFLVRYNNVIGSTLLPNKYLSTPHKTPSDKVLWLTNSIDTLLAKPKELHTLSSILINIPAIDNYAPKSIDYMIDLFVVLVTKNPNSDITFNLKDLGDIELIPEMITYLETTEYQFITTHGKSVVHLYVYEDDILQPDTMLTVNANLDVIYNGVMDPCKTYHIVFGLDKQFMTSYKFNGYNPYPWFLSNIKYDRLLTHPDNTPFNGVPYGATDTNIYDSYPYTSPGQNPNDPRDGSWIFSHIPSVYLKYEHARNTALTVQISSITTMLRKV